MKVKSFSIKGNVNEMKAEVSDFGEGFLVKFSIDF